MAPPQDKAPEEPPAPAGGGHDRHSSPIPSLSWIGPPILLVPSKRPEPTPTQRSALDAPATEQPVSPSTPQTQSAPADVPRPTLSQPATEQPAPPTSTRAPYDSPILDYQNPFRKILPYPALSSPAKPKPKAKKKRSPSPKVIHYTWTMPAPLPPAPPSPESVRKAVETVVEVVGNDPAFVNSWRRNPLDGGNTFDWALAALNPSESFSGATRNIVFALLNTYSFERIYDPGNPEVAALVCTGIAEAAIKSFRAHPGLILKYNMKFVSRLKPVDHTAVSIQVDDNSYVIDWDNSLDPLNPMIYNLIDWNNGEHFSAVPYQAFLKGTPLPWSEFP